MPGKLFLSHAHADKHEAQALRRALEDRGVAVWEDALELRAGDRLSDLEREVKGARGLLLLWTPKANESEWVDGRFMAPGVFARRRCLRPFGTSNRCVRTSWG